MEVITIESKAFQELSCKLDKIFSYVKRQREKEDTIRGRLITSEDLSEVLGLSTRTLQRMRSNDLVSYKLIGRRCYYDVVDVKKALAERTLYCKPQNMKELHKNLLLRSIKIDDGATR